MDPITYSDYLEIMKELVGERLPKFNATESEMLKGSFDFLGLNYYITSYAFNVPPANPNYLSYQTDACANTTGVRNGIAIGTPTASPWLYAYPMAMGQVLNYINGKYNNPLIYIIENGDSQEKAQVLKSLNHTNRIEYFKSHLYYLHRAIRYLCDDGLLLDEVARQKPFDDDYDQHEAYKYFHSCDSKASYTSLDRLINLSLTL
ncbi:beta-glucosidase 12-like [Telopea speciosissima]|uniref:beta-glucosidase 12-like n=1 Tax=Telopea speciosissima TaxID=54955 RepID=UPI001CC48D21|nr:beta-glucosidase 12-like [Telopea speciosissima]